jgi:adenylate cyclase class IV
MMMSFGTTSASGLNWGDQTVKDEVDVRCRVTNGKAEIVTKIGRVSAANRVEVSVPVSIDDMLKFTRLFGAMPFLSKVGSRYTENFKKGGTVVSLVASHSKKLCYIEIERMTTREKEQADLVILHAVAKDLGVEIWNAHQQFLDFSTRLTEQEDWIFKGTADDVKRMKAEIKKMKSDKV